jgi:phospholipid/cholesterol/gamma-HCH transport system substrate-binding protein
MRRLIVMLALAPAVVVLAVVGLGASDSGSGYEVRAIFDNAAASVPGEDVRVAGVKVGVIESMDVTADKKAAVTLRIDDGRFTPFHSDARCTIRPQSLIGEKFVECQPGTTAGRPLRRIDAGAGEGEHLLLLANTSSPVDLDLVNDIMRLPYRERLSLLLNELGTGLAGRGQELNEVIHRANPALQQTDEVLNVLARQNRTLARLAVDSDRVLAPLARQKRRLANFIVQANATVEASAERRADIERSIERLPGFLHELRPLMVDLGGFAGEATPVVRKLGASAAGLDRLIRELGPFASACTAALRSLGEAANVGRPALVEARPLTHSLRRFARDLRPVAGNLDQLTASLDRTGGLNRALDYFFHQTLAVNGFDSLGHYLRTALLVDAACAGYANAPVAPCNANFRAPEPTEPDSGEPHPAAAASAVPTTQARARPEPLLDYLLGGDR